MTEGRTTDAVDLAKAKVFDPEQKRRKRLLTIVAVLTLAIVGLSVAVVLAFGRIGELETEIRDLDLYLREGLVDGDDVVAPAFCDGKPALWKSDRLGCRLPTDQ